jgi:hypothetical protein
MRHLRSKMRFRTNNGGLIQQYNAGTSFERIAIDISRHFLGSERKIDTS